MRAYLFQITALLCLAGLTGCSESHATESGQDASTGITFDASFEDAGATETPTSNVGVACESDESCDGEADMCLTDFPGGYCSLYCTDGEACPSGSSCVIVDRRGTAFCFADCDSSSDERTCRNQYGCANEFDPGICIPGCQDDSDCSDGLTCDPTGGQSGEGRCFDASSALGDACGGQSDCPAGSFCYEERWSGWPGGMCVQPGCDADSGSGCPDGSVCLRGGRGGEGLCFASCTGDSDCRDGYACTASGEFPDRNYCAPAFNDSELGTICSAGRGECSGGYCLSETDTGYPDSYCSALGCDPTDPSDCGSNGVCAQAKNTTYCLAGCMADSDCRTGYRCGPSDSADATSTAACIPGCTEDAQCARADDGFVCNVGTGLCRPAFNDAALGRNCDSTPADCEGGRCLDEESYGFPAGMCTFPGCGLSGTDLGAACPTDSVCVDDGEGDPALGICAPTCMAETDCRSGYTCNAGACQPACRPDSCSGGRACNDATGRCE